MTESVAKKATKIEDLMSNLLATLDETVFFPRLGEFLHEMLPVDRSVVRIVRDDDSSQIISENGQFIENGEILEKGAGPAGHVVRTRRPYFSNSIERDPLFAGSVDQDVRAELIVPISHEGIVIATAHFQCTTCEHDFSREDITNVQKILNEIKGPLSNMKMYLSAKNLNESLIKQIDAKEKELQKKEKGISISDNYKIEEKEIIGKSEAMKSLLNLADKVALTDVNCLLVGERGVGKEMIARRIHCRSHRAERGFISIDCSTLDERSLEIEIFGEESGSFNDLRVKNGLLELANGGTLFLNNIERLSLSLQSKINNFMHEKMAFRIGGHMPYRSDVRIMAASFADLNLLVQEGKMREEFLFNLNTMILNIPSLKERQDDIETLAVYFLNLNRSVEEQKSLSPGVIKALKEYNWPGNVRELQNVIERAYILADGMIIENDHLADSVTKVEVEEVVEEELHLNFSEMTLDELERRHITLTLEHLGGNKTKTAKMLGITVKTLYNKLHSYGMIGQKEA